MLSKITVLSVNAAGYNNSSLPWQSTADSFAASALASSPDLIALQAAPNELVSYLGDCIGEKFAYSTQRDSVGNNALFYNKERFSLIEDGSFFLSDTPSKRSRFVGASEDRICAWCALEDKSNGLRFFYLNASPEKNSSVLIKCIPMLLSAGAKYDVPTVMSGNFACFKGSYAYRALCSAVFKDACESFAPDETPIADKALAYIKSLKANAGHEYIFINHLVEPVSSGRGEELLQGESARCFDGVYCSVNLLSR